MKAKIHPTWYKEAKVTCACGNQFILGLTIPELQVEICSNCHPFYTGQAKYVDTAGRIEAFLRKKEKAKDNLLSKAERRKIKRYRKIQQEYQLPETLEELRTTQEEKTSSKTS